MIPHVSAQSACLGVNNRSCPCWNPSCKRAYEQQGSCPHPWCWNTHTCTKELEEGPWGEGEMRGIEGRGIGGFKGISPTSLSWVQRSKPWGHAVAVRGLLLFVPPVPCVKAICFQGLHQKGSTVCEGVKREVRESETEGGKTKTKTKTGS